MKVNVEGNHYSFDQISRICGDLDNPTELTVSKIRTHAVNTGLAVRVNGQVRIGPLRYLVHESDVPYIIRDLTGREVDASQLRSVASRLGYVK